MISPETFARYAAMRVPRYTSYPTAPHFSPAIDSTEYRGWLRALAAREPVSIYLHIPFCKEMCWYCGCHTTVARRSGPIDRYVAALLTEIRLVSEQLQDRLEVGHLHWGGGSPTLLPAQAIERLSGELRECFEFQPGSEVAVEIDPRTLTRAVAQSFARTGVNRASVGVQSFDRVVQLAIGRQQSFEVTSAAVDLLRGSGIERFNFDLIYGLPFQSVESCIDSVEQALQLRPDRLSVFGYAHVPSFKPHQRKIDTKALPGPIERNEQADAIARTLTSRGYRQIGLDHFALPGDSLTLAADNGTLRRNFQGYTTDSCRTLLGFGASAIGRLTQGFVQNATRIPDYERRLAGGLLATVRGCRLDEEDNRRGSIIEQLMCNYRARTGSVEASLDQLLTDGLIRRRGDLIEVVEEARPLVRVIAAAFDANLANSPTNHVTAV